MNIGPMEIVVVLVLALLVFGPKRLPQAGRSLGQAMREFRKVTSNVRTELGLDEVIDGVTDVMADLKSSTTIDLNASGKATATAGAATVAAAVPAADRPVQVSAPANDAAPWQEPDTATSPATPSEAEGLETPAPETASSAAAVATAAELEVEPTDAVAVSDAPAGRADA